ncbi:hypothetical protein KC19_9G177700 [Ceratodon purpureus]|uniref:F-box domain-containing protein n=1 Tax=Ceratodon purpureus TaxID=3225 RepID=A0A8T0GT66_CERPU|nr:hypothetical protein KC19_9G177700 [Ceratodon purpureus]
MGEGSINMDVRIWGKLGNHIDMSLIYAKLPMEEFFRLRQVCKEWNRLAADRVFLEESFRDPVPRPYFAVDSAKMGHRLLARNATSKLWSWTRLPSGKCAVAGLLCDYSESSDSNWVFNLHTRVFHALPPCPYAPADDTDFEEPLVGITVDMSVSPYSFKVILGEAETGTRIYDSKSNSWAQKPSTHVGSSLALESEHQQKPYCFSCNGKLYFRVWDVYKPMVDLHCYNLEKDEWQCGEPWVPDEVWAFCDMGVWQDCMFYLRMMPEPDAAIEVVEYDVGSADKTEGDWRVIDCMPEELRTWMLAVQEATLGEFGEEMEIQGVFCGEHVLVYNCVGLEDVTERAVLYNLEGKTWEKLQLPPSWPRVVKVTDDEEGDDEEGEEDEVEGDQDEVEGGDNEGDNEGGDEGGDEGDDEEEK